MYDRSIFKGHLTRLFPDENVKCFLWSQGYPITEFTEYAKRTTAQIARTVCGWTGSSGGRGCTSGRATPSRSCG